MFQKKNYQNRYGHRESRRRDALRGNGVTPDFRKKHNIFAYTQI